MKSTILVIDDDLIYRQVIQKILCKQYNILMAENHEHAFQLFEKSNPPNLIIADLHLPGIAGKELMLYIKTKLNGLKIPILVISGMDDENIINELNDIGISEYLIKPVERTKLKEKIANLLN